MFNLLTKENISKALEAFIQVIQRTVTAKSMNLFNSIRDRQANYYIPCAILCTFKCDSMLKVTLSTLKWNDTNTTKKGQGTAMTQAVSPSGDGWGVNCHNCVGPRRPGPSLPKPHTSGPHTPVTVNETQVSVDRLHRTLLFRLHMLRVATIIRVRTIILWPLFIANIKMMSSTDL